MKFSVITAASRSLEVMKNLRACFEKQTFKDFEHIIVYDGPPPEDIKKYLVGEPVVFDFLPVKDGRYGTAPRNRGTELASGEFIIFADDDDYYSEYYLQAFADLEPDNNSLCVVRMNDYGRILPGVPINKFPQNCDVGTPMCCFPRIWFDNINIRWEYHGGYSHDFEFVKKCTDTYKPIIKYSDKVVVAARNLGRLAEYDLLDSLPF